MAHSRALEASGAPRGLPLCPLAASCQTHQCRPRHYRPAPWRPPARQQQIQEVQGQHDCPAAHALHRPCYLQIELAAAALHNCCRQPSRTGPLARGVDRNGSLHDDEPSRFRHVIQAKCALSLHYCHAHRLRGKFQELRLCCRRVPHQQDVDVSFTVGAVGHCLGHTASASKAWISGLGLDVLSKTIRDGASWYLRGRALPSWPPQTAGRQALS